MIDELFSVYGSSSSKVYLLNNNYIIEWFFMLEEKYKFYINHRSDENWEKFWISLYQLFIMMESEFWKNFNALNGEFRWNRDVSETQNYLHRTLKEVIRIVTDTLNFLSTCILLFLGLALWMKIWGKPFVIPNEYKELVFTIFSFIFTLWGLMMAIGSIYLSQTKISLKKSPFNQFVRSLMPKKIVNKLDEIKKWEDNKLKKRIKIPNRH